MKNNKTPMYEALESLNKQSYSYTAKRNSYKTWEVFSLDNDNQWSFTVTEDCPYEHDEKHDVWDWRIDKQYFNCTEYAVKYLYKLISEKVSHIRIIHHLRHEVPDCCGCEEFLLKHSHDSWGCKYQTTGRESMLCSDCPIAEEINAKRDGVMLQYIKSEDNE